MRYVPFSREVLRLVAVLGVVLLADHARRDLPEEYGDLGLPASEFERHIAYDIGAAGLARRLSKASSRSPR